MGGVVTVGTLPIGRGSPLAETGTIGCAAGMECVCGPDLGSLAGAETAARPAALPDESLPADIGVPGGGTGGWSAALGGAVVVAAGGGGTARATSPAFKRVASWALFAEVEGAVSAPPVSEFVPRATDGAGVLVPDAPAVLGDETSATAAGAGFDVRSSFPSAEADCGSEPAGTGEDDGGGATSGGPGPFVGAGTAASSLESTGSFTEPKKGSHTTSAESSSGCSSLFTG
jgi:hypothetical protein